MIKQTLLHSYTVGLNSLQHLHLLLLHLPNHLPVGLAQIGEDYVVHLKILILLANPERISHDGVSACK